MVTYLVVLLQFQISIPEDNNKPDDDITNLTLILSSTTNAPKWLFFTFLP